MREVFPVVPPRVEYSLSEEGRELNKLVLDLSIWGRQWLERRGLKTAVEEDLDELRRVLGDAK